MLESTITKNICKELKNRGIWHMKIHGGPYQRAGIPDLLVIIKGHAFFFEVKVPGKKLTDLQWHTIREIRDKADTMAKVVNGWSDVRASLVFYLELCDILSIKEIRKLLN